LLNAFLSSYLAAQLKPAFTESFALSLQPFGLELLTAERLDDTAVSKRSSDLLYRIRAGFKGKGKCESSLDTNDAKNT
jgi:hypothetical protein